MVRGALNLRAPGLDAWDPDAEDGSEATRRGSLESTASCDSPRRSPQTWKRHERTVEQYVLSRNVSSSEYRDACQRYEGHLNEFKNLCEVVGRHASESRPLSDSGRHVWDGGYGLVSPRGVSPPRAASPLPGVSPRGVGPTSPGAELFRASALHSALVSPRGVSPQRATGPPAPPAATRPAWAWAGAGASITYRARASPRDRPQSPSRTANGGTAVPPQASTADAQRSEESIATALLGLGVLSAKAQPLPGHDTEDDLAHIRMLFSLQ
ncbi:unnamed protein product, partial [Polarella glacialis]